MIIVKASPTRPTWYTVCDPVSISKLLHTLESKDAAHVSVTFWNTLAFIIIKLRKDNACYFYIPQRLWRDVEHIISVRASGCSCWRCSWRRKRKRYLNTTIFEHVFEK